MRHFRLVYRTIPPLFPAPSLCVVGPGSHNYPRMDFQLGEIYVHIPNTHGSLVNYIFSTKNNTHFHIVPVPPLSAFYLLPPTHSRGPFVRFSSISRLGRLSKNLSPRCKIS